MDAHRHLDEWNVIQARLDMILHYYREHQVQERVDASLAALRRESLRYYYQAQQQQQPQPHALATPVAPRTRHTRVSHERAEAAEAMVQLVMPSSS